MRSINFPKIFNKNSTNIVKDFNATKQNTVLLLNVEKGELFGDPYFGLRLKRFLYEQNSYILKDIIIDEIYTQLALFMPQLKVDRKDINIVQDKYKIYCNFIAKNMANYKTDMYSICLYNGEEGK